MTPGNVAVKTNFEVEPLRQEPGMPSRGIALSCLDRVYPWFQTAFRLNKKPLNLLFSGFWVSSYNFTILNQHFSIVHPVQENPPLPFNSCFLRTQTPELIVSEKSLQ